MRKINLIGGRRVRPGKVEKMFTFVRKLLLNRRKKKPLLRPCIIFLSSFVFVLTYSSRRDPVFFLPAPPFLPSFLLLYGNRSPVVSVAFAVLRGTVRNHLANPMGFPSAKRYNVESYLCPTGVTSTSDRWEYIIIRGGGAISCPLRCVESRYAETLCKYAI